MLFSLTVIHDQKTSKRPIIFSRVYVSVFHAGWGILGFEVHTKLPSLRNTGLCHWKNNNSLLCTIGNINIMENTKTVFFAFLLLVSTRLIPEYLWTFQIKFGRHQREIQLRKMCTTGLCVIFFYIYLTIPFDFMQLLIALHRCFSALNCF